jgi:hypothetical protein
MFIAALFTIAKLWKQQDAPLLGYKNVAFIYNVILFSHKE